MRESEGWRCKERKGEVKEGKVRQCKTGWFDKREEREEGRGREGETKVRIGRKGNG